MASCPVNLMTLNSFSAGAPYALFRQLRRDSPVAWENDDVSTLGGHWNVFSKELVDKVMKAPHLFSNSDGPRLENPTMKLQQGSNVSPNLMDEPWHRKSRALVNNAFKPAAIERRRQHITSIATALIDTIINNGECDFVQAIAQRLPLDVICWILGVPDSDKQKVCDWANTMMLADDPDFSCGPEDSVAAQTSLVRYGAALAADHRSNPRDSLTMDMLTAEEEGVQLSDRQYGLYFLNLIIGGIETTRNSTAFGLAELIQHPEQYQMLVDSPELIPDAVEEILRFRAPIIYYRRTSMANTKLAGETIRKGDTVICWLASANHDEQVFEHPERFDITRCQRESVRKNARTFGVGPHFCLGVHLARLQLEVAFAAITQRMSNIRLVRPPTQVRSVFMDGYKEMAICFDKKRL